ncbi:uncharacterized protein LOC135839715 isoform X2 [Planococcus citri]|uniref:uncharacterized protein LOC135839715 isoform X2 n=1 Tax=Planococcus citri TaxID=170843 RepID=UPI0031FA35D3
MHSLNISSITDSRTASMNSDEHREPDVSEVRKSELIKEHKKAASRIPAPSSEFSELIHSPVFVDKSSVIAAIMEPGASSFLVTAPRGCGKSSIAQMLKTFLTIQVTEDGIPISKSLEELYHGEFDQGGNPIDENGEIIPNRISAKELRMRPVKDTSHYELFTNPIPGIPGQPRYLSISKDENMMTGHLGKYPVVYVNLTCGETDSYENLLRSVQSAISKSYKMHAYLIDSKKLLRGDRNACKQWCDAEKCHEMSEERTRVTLKNLTRYLYKHFNRRCYVIVDEIDAIAMSCLFSVKDDDGVFEKITRFITSVMYALIKSNNYIRSGFLTGITQIVTVDNVLSRRFLQSESFFPY